jgi:hypothetical protein
MDNIKWITFQSLRGRKTTLEDFDFQVYRKPNAKTEGAGNYLAFSEFLSELYCDKKFLKIGTIEEKIVLSFNDVEVLPVRKNGSGSKRLRVSCKPLIDVIFQKYPYDKDIATNQQANADAETPEYDPTKVSQAVESTVNFKATTSYIEQATGTVACQLQSLLSSDSPYVKQAEEKAKEHAGRRGLLNTTMAARAGQ